MGVEFSNLDTPSSNKKMKQNEAKFFLKVFWLQKIEESKYFSFLKDELLAKLVCQRYQEKRFSFRESCEIN